MILIYLVYSIEYYQEYMNARDLHKSFLLLMSNDETADRQHMFLLAEEKYQKASQRISERLSKLFLAYDDLCIIIGQTLLLTVTEAVTSLNYLLKLKGAHFLKFFFFSCVIPVNWWNYFDAVSIDSTDINILKDSIVLHNSNFPNTNGYL